jgi:single-stranded DNA-specific DHH superfamily exonuclease
LAEKLKNTETELETLKESGNAGTASTSGLANEAGMRARALEAQLSALKAEKERQNESFNQEREKLQKEIKQMATQQTQTVKPTVSSAPSTARVKSQPQVIVLISLKIKCLNSSY